MNSFLPVNARKGDIVSMLVKARTELLDLTKDLPWVTKESWDSNSNSRISFHKDKVPALKAAGFLDDREDYAYGYHLSNERADKYRAIARLLGDARGIIECCTVRPVRHYSEYEKSHLTVIKGGYTDERLIELLGGVANGQKS